MSERTRDGQAKDVVITGSAVGVETPTDFTYHLQHTDAVSPVLNSMLAEPLPSVRRSVRGVCLDTDTNDGYVIWAKGGGDHLALTQAARVQLPFSGSFAERAVSFHVTSMQGQKAPTLSIHYTSNTPLVNKFVSFLERNIDSGTPLRVEADSLKIYNKPTGGRDIKTGKYHIKLNHK